MDGISTSSIAEKAIPAGGFRSEPGHIGQLGCWRAHMNALRRVVERRIETALIMEADMDWDIRIKKQMTAIGERLPGSTPSKPYG